MEKRSDLYRLSFGLSGERYDRRRQYYRDRKYMR